MILLRKPSLPQADEATPEPLKSVGHVGVQLEVELLQAAPVEESVARNATVEVAVVKWNK